jgi:hypothetical protein
MTDWAAYKIAVPKGPKSQSGEGRLLETVYHVAHVPEARRILEDGRLKAGLVYDESVLNRSRIAVTWLSANTWGLGSIYGNVEFTFRWSELIVDRRFYWVEAMTTYTPHAYRILLTERDLSRSKYVKAYDPASEKGPLRQRGDEWYWNGDYTSEFMIEADIPLDDCVGFEFITHHDKFCSLHRSACPDLSCQPMRAGDRTIAFLLGNNLHSIDHVLKRPSIFDPKRLLSHAVDVGVDGIMRTLGRKDRFGGGIKAEPSRKSVLRGALAMYGGGQKKAARELIALLKSQSVFEAALADLVNEHFEITGWTLPE